MSDEQKPDRITLDAQLETWEKARASALNRRRTWKRSTLTQRAAEQMLPWINQLLQSPGEILRIPHSAFPGNSPHTIYMKWKDSLIWFMQCDVGVTPEQKRAIAWIKAACKVARESGELLVIPPNINARECGIIVNTKATSYVAKEAAAIVRQEQRANDGWKQEFVEFIQSGADGDTFHRKGLFSPDDIQWVKGVLSSGEFASNVTISEIKVTKI